MSRDLLLAALVLTLRTGAAGAEPSPVPTKAGLFAGRGFAVGRCYSHPAIRRCRAKPPSCDLELFPARTGSLHFALDPATQSLISGKDTTDYGIFLFRMQAKGLEILDISDVSLRKWESVQDAEPIAKEAPCSR